MKLEELAMGLFQNNPNIANSPLAQQAIMAIRNGDNETGERIATNLLASMDMTREEALDKAKQHFGIH